MEIASTKTAQLVDDYYGSWGHGISSFDDARVRGVLAEDLDFEGPIARKRREVQRARTASDEALDSWLEPSPSPLEVLALRRWVDRLASAPPALG